ncbi:MAG: M14 family metallopeptidase [Clostridia bacterium]|nr:M14 family metallopeptidase [Clostridia bacterium]
METLRYGSRGPFVEYLQLALKRAGYDPGNTDGVFGTRTLDALTRFQRANGLDDDGIAGRRTWAALYPYLAGYTLHKARAGDTYYALARRYDAELSAVERANPGIPAENIPVGAELVIPLRFHVVPENVRWSYALNEIVLDGLTARYPFIRMDSAGSSVMGKSLSTAAIGRGEKEVFYNASHHANEWITTPLLWSFLEDYAAAYAAGGEIGGLEAQRLYEETTLYLLPLVDPDGVDLVTGALPAGDSYYAQAEALAEHYPLIPFPEGWKANIRGVDLNLGYPAGWEEARRIKFEQGYTRPGPRDYVGTAPLSEPENRAVYDFTQAHDFRLTLSYHTQGMVIYYKYLDYDPPRADEIAAAFEEASGYTAELTPYASGFAGYKDWFIQTYNRPGYTIEAGRGENPLPLSQLPAIYRDNLGILTLGMALS